MPHVKITTTSGDVTELDVDLDKVKLTRAQLVDVYAAALAQEKNSAGNYRFKQELGLNDDKVFAVNNTESVRITGA